MTSARPVADPVVVGVDGSAQATAAVRWGAREAERLGAPLRLVHTWLWPLYHVPLGPAGGAPAGAGLRAEAERVLTDAAATARAVSRELVVERELVVGEPAAALLRSAEGASRLVLGHRGLGGFAGLLLGSTGVTVSSHATCPVAVVRGSDRDTGPVVVGVDGSKSSDAAVELAAAEARLRGAPLLLVHAWTVRLQEHHLDSGTFREAAAAGEQAGRSVLAEAEQRVAGEAAGVPVLTSLTDRSAAAELVSHSGTAQLVVVGSRGVGPLTGLLLGSTAHALIHHSDCPVLVHRS